MYCDYIYVYTRGIVYNILIFIIFINVADSCSFTSCWIINQCLTPFIIKNAPARVNYPEALGLRHLAFKVESIDDTVKELNGKGIETEPVRLDDYTGKKMTFFHDPDGLPLEIHE